MTVSIPFDNSFAALPPAFFSRVTPTPVKHPKLRAFNGPLAQILRITATEAEDMARVFSGNTLPDGADPVAQLYAGHQFGNFNPQLGDGRAILLGEVTGTDGQRRDIQLKGSGPTPYSRMGDGRAWLGPVLREYVVSEAMAAMGVPTTRALAVVETGEPVYREAGALPGAVLTRVAASHLRVGTFQVFAARGQKAQLQRLTDYAIARHYPDAEGPMGLLRAACAAQARLIPQWMAVGFIHGVMNTDNAAISGETIDYGPCAFLDTYDAETVFSSIDRGGRYAYGNQPDIAVWNMAQLASALVGLMPDTDAAIAEATEIVHAMPEVIRSEWTRRFAAKIGISTPRDGDAALVGDLLERMQSERADFTNTFRALITGNARDQFTDPTAFDGWEPRWRARLEDENHALATMRAANPAVIPRNHRLEEMIAAAVAGDYGPFERLNAVLAHPFEDQTDARDLTSPPAPHEVVAATFCGT